MLLSSLVRLYDGYPSVVDDEVPDGFRMVNYRYRSGSIRVGLSRQPNGIGGSQCSYMNYHRYPSIHLAHYSSYHFFPF
ncbi:MAG: hypothetical protein QM221_02725, partial [Bacillota bacterium]|nr:hypothetical protein [Bacillota bacterium]